MLGKSPTIEGNISLSAPGLLLGVIPIKQIQRPPKFIALHLQICVYDVTGLMNIQGGVQVFTHDPLEAISAGRWVESLPKIVKLTFDFAHFLALLDNQIFNRLFSS